MKNVVLYIGEMEFPDKNAASQRVLANAKIIKFATDNELIMVGLKKQKMKDILDEGYTIDGMSVFEHRYPDTYMRWLNYSIDITYIRRILTHIGEQRISAIIAYNYPAIALERLRLLCKRQNIKLISDTSEWYGKSKRSFPSNLIKNLDTFLRMRFVNKRCNNLICASNYLEKYYKNIGNIINIPSLVDDTQFRFNHASLTLLEETNVKKYSYVGSPGRSNEKDKLDWIIDAFYKINQESDNFQLVIVGISRDYLIECYPELEEKVESLEKHIDFRGRVSHIDAIRVITDSDFTLCAREVNRVTSAGFPTKLAESYACKTPVITTPNSNVSDYIIIDKTGYVSDYCDENSFYEVIKLSMDADQHKIIAMRDFLAQHNPLSIVNFLDKATQFFANLK